MRRWDRQRSPCRVRSPSVSSFGLCAPRRVRDARVFTHLEHLECSYQPHIQGQGAKKRTQQAG